MKYVLIVIMTYGYSGAPATFAIEFGTHAACVEAGQKAAELAGSLYKPRYACVPRGVP
jgi:hypothetical protein